MSLDYAATHRQADANAIDLAVRTREHLEDPGRLVGVDSDPVVTHGHDPSVAVAQCRELDPGRRFATELERVADHVLQHAAKLPAVSVDLRQLADFERRASGLQTRAQVLGDFGGEPPQRDPLDDQLASPCVDEHTVDQVPRPLGARPQPTQHVGRRRLLGAPLEQPDQKLDARDRLAHVVRHDFGIAAQLGLHAPLLGHVGEEVDQPVAELRGAVHEGPQHIAVPEGRVVGDLLDPRLTGVAHPDEGVEGAPPAHPRQRLQQRVAIARRRWHPEAAQHRGIAVTEDEVDDAPVVVAHRPQDPHRLGEAVEQGAKLRGSLRTEELDELRVLSPRLRIEGVPSGHGSRI